MFKAGDRVRYIGDERGRPSAGVIGDTGVVVEDQTNVCNVYVKWTRYKVDGVTNNTASYVTLIEQPKGATPTYADALLDVALAAEWRASVQLSRDLRTQLKDRGYDCFDKNGTKAPPAKTNSMTDYTFKKTTEVSI